MKTNIKISSNGYFFILFTFLMYFVYILKGAHKHYIGYTNNIQRRLSEHKRGGTITTKTMKDFVLLGYFEKDTEENAQKLETMIKKNGHIHHRINHPTFIKL